MEVEMNEEEEIEREQDEENLGYYFRLIE